MFKFNFNSSKIFLFFLVFLFVTGCARQQTISYSVPEELPVKNATSEYQTPVEITRSKTSIQLQPQHTEYTTVWERLFDLYALPKINNNRIDKEIKRYLKHPEYLQTIQKRAAPYLYAIVEEIEAKGLPGELALLPIVESAFKPDAYSSSKAAGLWQFIPSTGRFLGLKQNWWYDGRRDIHASTKVATDYLKELNGTFSGDWMLALASYNAGKGTVSKAIKKNRKQGRPTDYWSLPLSKETRQYVPRLLAISKIFAHSDDYNIPLLPIPNQQAYEIVDVGSQLDFTVAAKLANTPISEFINLNPGYKRACTAPNGPHHLLIPAHKAESFKHNLARLADHERMTSRYRGKVGRHKIRPGENLGSIAKRYGTTVTKLRLANNLRSNNIIAGNYLFIPDSGNTKANSKQNLTYIVKKGDNLWEISRKFSVTPRNIIRWNRLAKNTVLHPGQKLIIKNVKTTIAMASSFGL